MSYKMTRHHCKETLGRLRRRPLYFIDIEIQRQEGKQRASVGVVPRSEKFPFRATQLFFSLIGAKRTQVFL